MSSAAVEVGMTLMAWPRSKRVAAALILACKSLCSIGEFTQTRMLQAADPGRAADDGRGCTLMASMLERFGQELDPLIESCF